MGKPDIACCNHSIGSYDHQMNIPLKPLSNLCFILGFVSILGSIGIWYFYAQGPTDPESLAHAERFGIFVGLWAPTFFILSNRFDRYASSKP